MAIHITCGFANVIGRAPGVLGWAVWSETMTTAGVAPQAAPDLAARQAAERAGLSGYSCLLFQIDPDVDVWVAIGSKDQPPPDPNQASGSGASARWKVRAGIPREFFCSSGSRIAWTPV